MWFFYSLLTRLYGTLLSAAAIGNSKASDLIKGREASVQWIKKNRLNQPVWIHCASLGEFEQARSLIDQLADQGEEVVVTFYSPSGYLKRHNYPKIRKALYLPLDLRTNVIAYLDSINPKLLILVKYEFWPNLIRETWRAGVPISLVAALFHEKQLFFSWYGSFYRSLLSMITHYFVQDQASADLLLKNDIKKISVTGDTRVDRVSQLPNEPFSSSLIESFCGEQTILVAGSTWKEDEEVLLEVLKTSNFKLLLAPHEVDGTHLKDIKLRFSAYNPLFYSSDSLKRDSSVLVIDSVGQLNKLYRYGKYAYVGGGFRTGLHNTLEPAAYGLPVFFGATKHDKFVEARELRQIFPQLALKSAHQMLQALESLESNHELYMETCGKIEQMIQKSMGATDRILTEMKMNKWI